MRLLRLFFGFIGTLPLLLTWSQELGHAQENCLIVKTMGSDKKLGWKRKVFRFESQEPQATLALDVDGDGIDEILIRDQTNIFWLIEFLHGEEIRAQALDQGDSQIVSERLQRIGAREERKERLFSSHGLRMQASDVEKATHSTKVVFEWNPEGKNTYLPASNAGGWRCSELPGPATRIFYTEQELQSHESRCSSCLNFLTPLTSLPDPSLRCAPKDSQTGLLPLDIDGDGVEEALYSSNNLSTWHISQFSTLPTFWADFPNRLPWKHFFLGDFNGDGLGDILLISELFRSTWLAASQSDFAIEGADRPPFSLSSKLKLTSVGDFDGNGTSDIADIREKDGMMEIEIAFRERPMSIEKNVELLDVEIHPLNFLFFFSTPVSYQFRTSQNGIAQFCGLRQDVEHLMVVGTPGETLRGIKKDLKRSWPVETGLIFHSSTSPKAVGARGDYSIFQNYPKVCLGYHLKNGPPAHSKWGEDFRLCDENSAIFGNSEGFKNERLGSGVVANCCPLPFSDILETREQKAFRACPDGMVITGNYFLNESCSDCPLQVRCTAINSKRYRLGRPQPGRYWGSGFSGRMQDRRYQLSDIPLGIRTGVARNRYGELAIDGCMGEPPGSLLTERNGKSCSETVYRELLYRGLPGDPPDGTPVKMFPDCRKIENMFDPYSGCFPDPHPELWPLKKK